jgi:hypothetical protein
VNPVLVVKVRDPGHHAHPGRVDELGQVGGYEGVIDRRARSVAEDVERAIEVHITGPSVENRRRPDPPPQVGPSAEARLAE